MDDLQQACFFACARYSRRVVSVLAIALMTVAGPFALELRAQLFEDPPPPLAVDEVVLVSTRSLRGTCSSMQMERCLCSERLVHGAHGAQWLPIHWQEVVAERNPSRQTIFYVHGNRIAADEARRRGRMIYQSLVRHRRSNQPIRLIIWSWPATQVPGPLKDYYLKSAESRQAGWQFAWFLDQMPDEVPVSIIGYSLGTRVVSGALHLLGGGELDGLHYRGACWHPSRGRQTRYRVALVAAAYDADWVQPHNYYGRGLAKTDQLWVLTNRLDPAMRFFNLSTNRGRVPALGWVGAVDPFALGQYACRVHPVDVTEEVGRHHGLVDYLGMSTSLGAVWRQLIQR